MADRFAGGIKANSTSVSMPLVLRKTADNTEQTGKIAADMTASYWRQGGSRVAISLSDLGAVNSAWSSGGVKEVDASNQPGLYRLDLPDAALASGADWVVISVKVASTYLYHERFALESAGAAELAGGTGVNLTRIDGQATNGNNATLNLKQLNIVNTTGSALVATSSGANGHGMSLSGQGSGHGMQCVGGASGTGINANVAGNVVGNITGSLSGSVGSVVASVTVGGLSSGVIGASAFAANALDANALAADAANEIADALLDRANGIETGISPRLAWRYIGATVAGKLSGSQTGTEVFAGLGVSTTRVTVSADSSGNRTAVVYA